jgi:hypothetical protein
MDFETYTRLIADSVAECGYDEFFPSLCVVGDKLEMQVLAGELQPHGEREVAMNWADTFKAPGQVLYLAYRIGGRQVEVIKLNGAEVTQRTRLDIQS